MLIKSRKSWHLTDNDVTPEHLYLNRRAIMAAGGAAAVSLTAGACSAEEAQTGSTGTGRGAMPSDDVGWARGLGPEQLRLARPDRATHFLAEGRASMLDRSSCH